MLEDMCKWKLYANTLLFYVWDFYIPRLCNVQVLGPIPCTYQAMTVLCNSRWLTVVMFNCCVLTMLHLIVALDDAPWTLYTERKISHVHPQTTVSLRKLSMSFCITYFSAKVGSLHHYIWKSTSGQRWWHTFFLAAS